MAEVNGKLGQFIEWYRKHKKLSPSLTKLFMKDVSKGSGQKGGKAPLKKKKSVSITERIEPHPIVVHQHDEQCTSDVYSTEIESDTSSLHTTISKQMVSPLSHPVYMMGTLHSPVLTPAPYAVPMDSSLYAAPTSSAQNGIIPLLTIMVIRWCNSFYPRLLLFLQLLIVCKSFSSNLLWATLVCVMGVKMDILRIPNLLMIYATKQKSEDNLLLLVVFYHKPVNLTLSTMCM